MGLSGFLLGQKNSLQSIKEGLVEYQEKCPVEKLYIHLDRSPYLSGESIWFKGYLTAGPLHLPSTLSGNIYVELIKPNGALISRITVHANDGVAQGYIGVPDSIRTGQYRVRGYTNWMRNFTPDFLFVREVAIFNLSENNSSTQLFNSEAIDLQFFPEGGDLIAGFESVVGFKASTDDGKGKLVRGSVFDDLGNLIVSFESSELGMGKFAFKPDLHKNYFAQIENTVLQFPLPQAKSEGYSLSIRNIPDSKNVEITIRTNIIQSDNEVITIVHCRGLILFTAVSTIASGELHGFIARNLLQSGINCVTIFDKAGNPLAERLFFIDQRDQLKIKMSVNKAEFRKREKVIVDLDVRDGDGNPVKSSLSLSATDETQDPVNNDAETIVSYLWLHSDLVGTIDDPGSYFDEQNTDRQKHLDILLLTQGWRRFNWSDITNQRHKPIQFPIENGFSISWILREDYTNKPVPRGRVSFLSSDSTGIFGMIETDSTGRFQVSDLECSGDIGFLFQGQYRKKNQNVWIQFDTVKEFAPGLHPIQSKPRSIDITEENMIARGSQRKKMDATFKENTVLEEVVVVGKKGPDYSQPGTYSIGYDAKMIVPPEVHGWGHPLQLLIGKVPPSMQIVWDGTGYRALNRGRPVTILWDGWAMVPPSMIDAYSAASVERVVFTPRGISFFSKFKGKGYGTKKATNFILHGYQSHRQFYGPKYDKALPEHLKPDYRNTLHWQPDIITDDEGKAKLEFYTSDLATDININVEGISATGKPGVCKVRIKVKD